MTDRPDAELDEVVERYHELAIRIESEIGRRIVGQTDVVRDVVVSLLCQGHVLLEGVPGLGKTELLKALGRAVDLSFARIQFTPDLMPADVIGTQVLETDEHGHRQFEFQPGPIFANLLLADEINRATPKSQSALLEAMQEHQVTVAGETRHLPEPFLVMATQNPIELEGTYPLPEAQLDRFLLKVQVPSPSPGVLTEILRRTTGTSEDRADQVCSSDELRWMIRVTRHVPIAGHLLDYTSLIVSATHPHGEGAPGEVRRYVRTGASPRGGQAMVLAAKARALLGGRPHVSAHDITSAAGSALRHRLVLGYEAAADDVTADQIVRAVLAATPEPRLPRRGTP